MKIKGPLFFKKMIDGLKILKEQILKAEAVGKKDEEMIPAPNYLDFWDYKISRHLKK